MKKIFRRPLILVFLMVLIAYLTQQVFRLIHEQTVILRAVLVDDISGLELELTENNEFELIARTIFGDQTFEGNYKLHGNDVIIFLDRPYDNDFIPDTVWIIDNKIILSYDDTGNPITDFATYFRIDKNLITKE